MPSEYTPAHMRGKCSNLRRAASQNYVDLEAMPTGNTKLRRHVLQLPKAKSNIMALPFTCTVVTLHGCFEPHGSPKVCILPWQHSNSARRRHSAIKAGHPLHAQAKAPFKH